MKQKNSISKTNTGTEPVAQSLVADKQIQSSNRMKETTMRYDPPRAAYIISNQRHCIFSQLLTNTFCSPKNASNEKG